ncbi:flagellar basal body-associated FliL family protein [Salinarimonas sp.]|uniref:flagellar basal body-associated FliL family protein n=1 Tax=Salinarimonas sp. TaxID=2766526 RepID=UPI0039188729
MATALLPSPAARKTRERSSSAGSIGGGILLTALGAATGIGLGFTLGEIKLPEPPAAERSIESRYGENVSLVRLPSIVTNLAAPADTWVRLDASLVFEGTERAQAETMASAVSGDLLGYLRTLTLAQIEGAAGLAHLREDVEERARSRTDGRVREVVIETLVVQ